MKDKCGYALNLTLLKCINLMQMPPLDIVCVSYSHFQLFLCLLSALLIQLCSFSLLPTSIFVHPSLTYPLLSNTSCNTHPVLFFLPLFLCPICSKPPSCVTGSESLLQLDIIITHGQ